MNNIERWDMSYQIGKDAWVKEDIGEREYFEDAHLLVLDFLGDSAKVFGGVFDGHSGTEVASLASKRFSPVFQDALSRLKVESKALEETFAILHEETVDMKSGSVVAVFYLTGRDLYVANVGDSEILLVSDSDHLVLTECHRLSNQQERMRVIEAGGLIRDPYVLNIDGTGLMCTRSMGDHDFRKAGVIHNPYIGRYEFRANDRWLVAASDGLWDVMKPSEVAAIARRMTTARAMTEALHTEARKVRRTEDNLTLLVIRTPAYINR